MSEKLLGVEPAPLPQTEHGEFPKWVVPHASHLDAHGLAAFSERHTDRSGVVTVLVHDKTEEERALAPVAKPEAEQHEPEAEAEHHDAD